MRDLLSFVLTNSLFYLFGDDGGGVGTAAVAGENGVAHNAALAVGMNFLMKCKTLVSKFFQPCAHLHLVVEEHLAGEVDVVVDYEHGEVALGGDGDTYRLEIVGLAEVEEFHDDGVVDMALLVNVVVAYL